jgi:hypothetical protein
MMETISKFSCRLVFSQDAQLMVAHSGQIGLVEGRPILYTESDGTIRGIMDLARFAQDVPRQRRNCHHEHQLTEMYGTILRSDAPRPALNIDGESVHG